MSVPLVEDVREKHGEHCACCNTDWAKISELVQANLERKWRRAGV